MRRLGVVRRARGTPRLQTLLMRQYLRLKVLLVLVAAANSSRVMLMLMH
jgi:hypothetical protein